MKIQKVKQRTGKDCFRCCLAMVIGFPYEDVPDFVAEYDTDWAREAAKWLEARGMGLIQINVVPVYIPPWLPLIAKGFPSSDSTHHHCVVWTEDEMIDPHPENIGVMEIAERYMVVFHPTPATGAGESATPESERLIKEAYGTWDCDHIGQAIDLLRKLEAERNAAILRAEAAEGQVAFWAGENSAMIVELTKTQADLAKAREEAAGLRAELLGARRWIYRYTPADFKDHACATCAPESEILIPGFVCEPCRAKAAIDAAKAQP